MKKWLFNPFELVAGWTALLAGLIIIVATAALAVAGNIRLDGVLDLHVGNNVSFATCLLEGCVNWISISFFIYLAGLIFSRSSIRPIDVLGTQALARFPMLISCVVSLLCFNEKILKYLEYTFLHQGTPVTIGLADVLLFGCMIAFTLLMTVWYVSLMYHAYTVACNVKGTKAVISFIAGLVFAEIVSKIAISFI